MAGLLAAIWWKEVGEDVGAVVALSTDGGGWKSRLPYHC